MLHHVQRDNITLYLLVSTKRSCSSQQSAKGISATIYSLFGRKLVR